MKIGIVGGMSWVSSSLLYNLLHQEAEKKNIEYPDVVLSSINFNKILNFQNNRQYDKVVQEVQNHIDFLYYTKCDKILICSNTISSIYLTHSKEKSEIIDIFKVSTATINNVKKIGIIGTESYNTLTEKYNIYKNFLIVRLEKEERYKVNQIIYENLCRGKIESSDIEYLNHLILKMYYLGAEKIILGCTELSLLSNYLKVKAPKDILIDSLYELSKKAIKG